MLAVERRNISMDFYTVRDMRTTPKSLWDSLTTDDSVVITNNSKPTALMLDISDGSLEEPLKAVRQAKAMIAFNSMRERAAMNGFISNAEIEAEIAAARISALRLRNGAPARAVGLILSGHLIPCYDHRIMLEYRQVLQRPKFRFRPAEINALLGWFKQNGRSVVPAPVEMQMPFVDEAD